MQIIAPQLACLVNEEEFHNGTEHVGYPIVYIIGATGRYWKFSRLQGGGHVSEEVKSIPTVEAEPVIRESSLREGFSFLPDGKIPLKLLNQILAFFHQVMVTYGGRNANTHGALEAMAHILWTPEQGYFVAIPTQTVTGTSVKYVNDHIPEGAMVVVDIHSHNTMSAFFSGTDNNDDKQFIGFSGVAGHLHKEEAALKWRFNWHGKKWDMDTYDIFLEDKEENAVPEAWLKKVSKTTYSPAKSNFGLASGGAGKKPGSSTGGFGNQRVAEPVRYVMESGRHIYRDANGMRVVPRGMGNGWEPFDAVSDFSHDPYVDMDDTIPFNELGDLDDASLRGYQNSLFGGDGLGKSTDEDDDSQLTHEDIADSIRTHLEDIEEDLDLLADEEIAEIAADEVFKGIINECYDRLSDDAKTKIAIHGL